MSEIEKQLRAAVRFDAVNGDANERHICANQMLAAASEIERLRAEVEWLWENCKIVFWQPGEVLAYPIEHDPVAGKDGRAMIEAARKAREGSGRE